MDTKELRLRPIDEDHLVLHPEYVGPDAIQYLGNLSSVEFRQIKGIRVLLGSNSAAFTVPVSHPTSLEEVVETLNAEIYRRRCRQ